jgi:hypothetical protein
MRKDDRDPPAVSSQSVRNVVQRFLDRPGDGRDDVLSRPCALGLIAAEEEKREHIVAAPGALDLVP